MVLFLRPTESETIFIQQLGRGLRKYPGKDHVTVLDFIGNNYDRAVQICLALGTLADTTYMEKAYLKQLIKDDFSSLGINNLKIEIDELSKEEIIHQIDKTNFNLRKYLISNYESFKTYINNKSYPKHSDYLNSDVAPDFIRFIKSSINNTKNMSYYNFLKKIGEESIPYFDDDDVKIINSIEDLLPITRLDEYLIIEQLLTAEKIDLKRLEGKTDRVTENSLENALNNIKALKIIDSNGLLKINNQNGELKEYIKSVLNYGIVRYDREFGEYEGLFKKYSNYYKEQAARIIGINGNLQKGTHYENDIVYIFAGLKKDIDGKLNYKDKFIDDSIFQWESVANISSSEKEKIRKSKKVHLFVRKMKSEDGITLPYTYFGLGEFKNERESFTEENGKRHNTLLFDIVLDSKVPEKYHVDFQIDKN